MFIDPCVCSYTDTWMAFAGTNMMPTPASVPMTVILQARSGVFNVTSFFPSSVTYFGSNWATGSVTDAATSGAWSILKMSGPLANLNQALASVTYRNPYLSR
jgi:hypothetical protein